MTREELVAAIAAEFGSGCAAICQERARQIEEEGMTRERDVKLYKKNDELRLAAATYILPDTVRGGNVVLNRVFFWPWWAKWWKPKTEKADLTRGAAIVAARLDIILK